MADCQHADRPLDNCGYVNPVPDNANDRLPQSTLRKLRAEFSSPAIWLAMAGVAAIMAIAGPFGTIDLMTFGPRTAYWAVLVVASYASGAVIGTLTGPVVISRLGFIAGNIALGVLIGLAVSIIVVVMNLLSFPDWYATATEMAQITGVVVPIAVIVSFLLRLLENHQTAAPSATAPSAYAPAILSRLPLDRRGRLVSMTVEDHYVRVRTTGGEELVLMRLSDAIRETQPEDGLQVHRSHWVATDAVTAARREGDRAILTLSHGPEIPVSRANIAAVREAGLLP